ncbi:unnamed protein product [Symbiodinium sp. CCMP2592]|nr:unnamed protein product [Symbiodinium sp. CCMP2592]
MGLSWLCLIAAQDVSTLDDECANSTCALNALQMRQGLSQGTAVLDDLLGAFKSERGLLVRATDDFATWGPWPESASALRWDLPPALYAVRKETEVTGLVLQPKMEVECAYPVNSNSNFRQDAQGKRNSCGRTTSAAGAGRKAISMSGACSFASPQDYAQAYFNTPQHKIDLLDSSWWDLNSATCHFSTVSEALAAQKALWQLTAKLPRATTAQAWLRNASRVGFALTAFNEIIVAPVQPGDVLAVFWAHVGPFRDPGPSDAKACLLSEFLKTNSTWRIIEVADVILERPTSNCEVKFESGDSFMGDFATNSSCLLGFTEAMRSLEQKGPGEAAPIFRQLEASDFLKATQEVCHN